MGGLISVAYAHKYEDDLGKILGIYADVFPRYEGSVITMLFFVCYIASLMLLAPAGIRPNVFEELEACNGVLRFKTNQDVSDMINKGTNGKMKIPSSLVLTALRHHKNHISIYPAQGSVFI